MYFKLKAEKKTLWTNDKIYIPRLFWFWWLSAHIMRYKYLLSQVIQYRCSGLVCLKTN